jgi:ferredoxin-type protein NapH
VCPFQLEPYKEFSDNNQFDNIDCIKCSTCVANCPLKILSLKKDAA